MALKSLVNLQKIAFLFLVSPGDSQQRLEGHGQQKQESKYCPCLPAFEGKRCTPAPAYLSMRAIFPKGRQKGTNTKKMIVKE
jgi:hypothetical protein